ncbi:hypothetical protein [Roseibium sp. SCP14]|uniref:hypothetical protein n=1 Tax=Roseibium sp. SCP14 TaxID=3141375 RepID=UPI0033379545
MDSVERMGGGRVAVQLDAVAKDAFDNGNDGSSSEKEFGFLRIVSTMAVLQKKLGDDLPLSVGDWVELLLSANTSITGPWVWSLQLRDNRFIGLEETGRPWRGKLVSLRRLASVHDPFEPRPLGASVPAIRSKGAALKARYSLLNVAQPKPPAIVNAYLRRWGRAWRTSMPAALDVGQASFNVITPRLTNEPMLYFDVGQPIWFHLHNAPFGFSPPCSDAGIVILSHWDTDHYAFGRQNPKFHEKIWIAPAQSSVGPNANKFAQLLQKSGHLLLVGTGKSSRHRHGVRIVRCSGQSMNGSGLALHLRTFGRDILFTGDADYHEIPSMRGVRLSGLQIPHHGGKMAKEAIIPQSTFPSRAVISCGRPNRYNHPNGSTIQDHLGANWKVEITADMPQAPRGSKFL